ncbi:MAG: TIGR03905 family TSCPD domain-containing protein [Clostridia bacterium]|nr:TIGR03905 family TSCPD domain-containing protein [Clostridia bacterium]
MKSYTYSPKGVCSMKITFDVDENDIVSNIKFTGGCNGNTQGVAALANGRKKDELIKLLSGIKCGFRPTSCPDQLANALKEL